MKLGLSMIIKNEESRISQNIGHIIDLFDDVVILDTGSSDNTISIIKGMGIEIESYEITHKDKHRLIEARNASIEKNKCERVLILDGDETISREDIIKIKEYTPLQTQAGFFLKWIDHRYETVFEDYKMCIINKNQIRFLFSVHACPQVYARDNGNTAARLHGPAIHHYPEHKPYRDYYIKQIESGINENPGCLRFYWFLGYNYFKQNNIEKAISNLLVPAENLGKRFPVETLNSIMILSSIYQSLGDTINAFHYISLGLDYYETVKNDFEVRVNFRLHKRYQEAQAKLLEESSAEIIPYEFAY